MAITKIGRVETATAIAGPASDRATNDPIVGLHPAHMARTIVAPITIVRASGRIGRRSIEADHGLPGCTARAVRVRAVAPLHLRRLAGSDPTETACTKIERTVGGSTLQPIDVRRGVDHRPTRMRSTIGIIRCTTTDRRQPILLHAELMAIATEGMGTRRKETMQTAMAIIVPRHPGTSGAVRRGMIAVDGRMAPIETVTLIETATLRLPVIGGLKETEKKTVGRRAAGNDDRLLRMRMLMTVAQTITMVRCLARSAKTIS